MKSLSRKRLLPGGRFLKSIFFSGLGIMGALVAGLLTLGYDVLPEPHVLSEIRKEAAEKVCEKALAALPDPAAKSIKKLYIAPLENDYTGFVTQTLRRTLDATGRFQVLAPRLDERIKRKLNLELHGSDSLQEILEAGKSVGADWVLSGHLDDFAERGDMVHVQLWLRLVGVTEQRVLTGMSYNEEYRKNPYSVAELRKKVHRRSISFRALVWMLMMVGAPVVAIPAIKPLLAKGSNGFNFALLITLCLIDLLLGFFLVGSGTESVMAPYVIGLGALAAFTYNLVFLAQVNRFVR